MRILMNENTEKLKAEIINTFTEEFGDKVPAKNKGKIQKYLSIYMRQKQAAYYQEPDYSFAGLKDEILRHIDEARADSKAEMVMWDALTYAEINFEFQYQIGPFRVDFLIDGWLVFELDGPLHVLNPQYDERRKKYIEGKGYKVLCAPLWTAFYDKQSIVETIKEQLNHDQITTIF